MSLAAIKFIKQLRYDLELTTPKLTAALGFKSKSTIWMIENGYRTPSFLMCRRLVEFARSKGYKQITIEKLMEEDNDQGTARLK